MAAAGFSLLAGPRAGAAAEGVQETKGAETGKVKVTAWAPDTVCGQVLALSADDEGNVFAAVTARSFGRGTVLLGKDAALLAEDRNLRSAADRARAAQAWLASGRLKDQLADRRLFYKDPGDGPENFLSKYSESVRRLEDTDHDGAADLAVPVADGFRDPADGAGGALLALANGTWLYGCPPHLWRLENRDGTDRHAQRTSVVHGFGVRNGDSEAGLHALLEAPDGWLYFGMGDRGYRVPLADGKTVQGLGTGAIFRCRPDGSGLEVFATGLHNPTGLAMNAEGRLFAVDQAAPGGKTRLLLVIPGADFGWRAEAVTEPGKGVRFDEGPETLTASSAMPGPPLWCLPPVALLELEASTLETLNRPADPADPADPAAPSGATRLLAADRRPDGQGGLTALRLEPAGAAFRLVESKEIWRGGAVLATAAGPDGSVFFADWGTTPGVFSHCHVRHLEWPGPAAPDMVPALIRTLPGLPARKLRDLLENDSPRVRLRAGQRLAAMPFQDSMEPLLLTARRSKNLAARVQAVWSAGTLAREDSALLNELVRFLSDPEPAVRAAAATMLGEGKLRRTPDPLRRALTDAALPVRLAAAAALGRLKTPDAAAGLTAAAAGNDSGDPFVRSSLAAALAAVSSAPALEAAGKASESREVRLTIVHALRRLAAGELGSFLADADPVVVAEAARAIYDLPVFPALPALAAVMKTENASRLPGPCLRRALAAALRGGLAENTAPAADLALAENTAPELRRAALETLAAWDDPPAEDPVRPRAFLPMPRLPGLAREARRRAATGLASAPDTALSALAKTILKPPAAAAEVPNGSLLTLAQNAAAPEDARLSAVRALVARNALASDTAHALSTAGAAPPAVRAEARSMLMRRDPKTAPALAAEAFLSGSIPEKQAVIRTLDHLPGKGNDNERLLLDAARRLSQGSIEPAIQVEVLEALQRRDIESRSPWRRATDAWLASLRVDTDSLAPWRMTKADGDPAAGRLVYETRSEAGCTACHSLQGQGGISGPSLDGVAGRLTPEELLESLIHPGASLARGWESRTLPDPADPAGTTSPMPPMGALLTLRELRDLMAFLGTLKADESK